MKKILIFITAIISITWISNADFWSINSLDLYSNIDKWIYWLQEQIQQYELEWWEKKAWILSEINKYAIENQNPACLDESKSINIDAFKNIVNEKNVSYESWIMKYLIPNCVDELLKEKWKEELTQSYDIALKELSDNKWENDFTAADCWNKTVELMRKVWNTYEKYTRPQNDAECQNEKYEEEKAKLLKQRDEKINNYWKDKNWNIEDKYVQEIVYMYQELFNVYNYDKATLAEVKTDQIYKISQIWIYADWNLDNSWFDLISDIEDIDKIIFANVIDYEGEQIDSVDDVLNDFFEPLNDKITELASPRPLIDEEENIIQPIQYSPVISNENPKDTISTSNEYACISDLNNSWLSNDALDWLLNNINKNLNWNNNIEELKNESWSLNDLWNQNNDSSSENNLNWNYEKVTDNSQWPCETFFCIMIDFSTYEHSLFWWWEDITIEYLLNRSNKHLSKHAATSLVPAKMWTNEFELWLKDLNLPDVFHLSFQVSTKPIPILNIEKQWKEDETEFSSKNMLKSYYELNWLDYERRNDLNALAKLEANKQNINNAAWLTIEELLKKQKENDSIVEERQKKANTLRKAIDERVSYWMISTFEEQFTELDKFTLWINDYINNLDWLIDQLRKIPIEY